MQDTPRRRTNSAHVAHVPARLQAMWAELVRRRGVSCVDRIYIFEIVMKNRSKYPSPIKIRDVAGTPNVQCGILKKNSTVQILREINFSIWSFNSCQLATKLLKR